MQRILLIFAALLILTLSITIPSHAATPPAPVPQTGQTLCSNSSGMVIPCSGTGQDGAIKSGVAWPSPRFTDNGNATVSDNLTGLIWTKDANKPGPAICGPATIKNWQEALDYAACLNTNVYLGYADWRVPTIRELGGLFDYERTNPALPAGHPFTSVQYNYWSSSTYASNADYAWVAIMFFGGVGYEAKTNNYFNLSSVWPVRSEQ